MRRFSISSSISLAFLAIACGSTPAPKTADNSDPGKALAEPKAAAKDKKNDQGSKGQIAISESILKACGLSASEAKFDFDSATVKPSDYPVLTKLAECFISGNLAGKRMLLLGHADPRGDEEYNNILGENRAGSVKTILTERKLPDDQADTSSRGEMDATGKDEAGWAQDRRVDIMMAR